MCRVSNPLPEGGINILDSSSVLKNRKLDQSCTSNPKSEVSDWTVPATRRFNGCGDPSNTRAPKVNESLLKFLSLSRVGRHASARDTNRVPRS